MILNALKNLPDHKSTLILGDSNTHGIKGDQVDPVNGSVAVRSFSGLCIVAAAHALRKYKYSYRNVKRLVWSLGTNDGLHSNEHCHEDFETHIKALYRESSRIFPQARISFILPFTGITGVSVQFTKELVSALKIHCPKMWRCRAPSMVDRMTRGGVHINAEGKRVYTNYLMKNFTKCTPQSNPQPRPPSQNRGTNAARSAYSGRANVRARGPPRASGPPRVSQVTPPPQSSSIPVNPAAVHQSPPAQPGHPSSMVHELVEALSHLMLMRRRGPQSHNTPPWYY